MKKKAYRHGELLFVALDQLPTELPKKAKTNIIASGSHGNDHTVTGAGLYLQSDGEYVIGYLYAKKNNKLYHPEHSPDGCSLPVGFYEIRTQMEHTHEGMKEVID